MKKLSIAIALMIGLSSFAFANEGEKKSSKKKAQKEMAAKAFKADVMVYKSAKFALHFKNGTDQKVKVTVTDNFGNVFYNDKIKNIEHLSKTYKMDEFPKGEYNVEVTNGYSTITKQIQIR